MNICPKNAIFMKPDSSGFLYPVIDETRCVDCSMCDSACQINKSSSACSYQEKYYALINKDEKHLKVSSSGGAFLAVAKCVFDADGVVVGCAFDDQQRAVHIATRSLDECIDKLCGSKYVQSDTQCIYKDTKKYLNEKKKVLFVGTPCQIEGLLLYLKERPNNLVTMDLICHGVSSPLLWEKHKDYLEKKVHAKINKYRFRGKEKAGWALYYYYYYYGKKNRCKKGPSVLDRYYTDFLNGVNYRESCYRCKFANTERVGDITIGDFWGAEKFLEKADYRKGVSLIMVNTERGKQLLEQVSNNVYLHEVTKENAIAYNHNLIAPTSRPGKRDCYYRLCFADFEKWEREYVETRDWKIAKLKSRIPCWIKKVLKR